MSASSAARASAAAALAGCTSMGVLLEGNYTRRSCTNLATVDERELSGITYIYPSLLGVSYTTNTLSPHSTSFN